MSGPGSDDSSDDDAGTRDDGAARRGGGREGDATAGEETTAGENDREGGVTAGESDRATDEEHTPQPNGGPAGTASGRERVPAPSAAGDGSDEPIPEPGTSAREGVSIEEDGVVRWFLKTDDETIVAIRDVISSVAVVAAIGLLLFGISGIWPPLVAVESGSMEPNMHRGDLVFVVEEGRFVGDDPVDGTGVVTYRTGAENGHEKFGNPGDVIIFRPDGSDASTPIIHRAHFWVEEGERWVETKANPEFTDGRSCEQLATCPAPHAGFITKGDANSGYDQAGRGAGTTVVKPEWVTGKAMFRIPWLGHVRLTFDELFSSTAPPVLENESVREPTVLEPDRPDNSIEVESAAPVAGTGPGAGSAPGPDGEVAWGPTAAGLGLGGGVAIAVAGRGRHD